MRVYLCIADQWALSVRRHLLIECRMMVCLPRSNLTRQGCSAFLRRTKSTLTGIIRCLENRDTMLMIPVILESSTWRLVIWSSCVVMNANIEHIVQHHHLCASHLLLLEEAPHYQISLKLRTKEVMRVEVHPHLAYQQTSMLYCQKQPP